MELKDYLRIFHKSWILILALTLVGIAGAAGAAIVTTPKYVASTQLYVSVQAAAGAATTDLLQGTSFARQAVTSYVDVVNSAIVLDKVIKDLNLDLTAADLADMVESSSPLNTVLIDVTVTNADPVLAAKIANSVGQNFAKIVVDQLEKPDGEAVSPVKIATIQPALVPEKPASPNVPLNIALGLLVGLALGIGLAVLRSVLDTRIHSLHDIELVSDAPMLGGITNDPDARLRPLVVHSDPKNPRAESFRSLRTNLQFVNIEGGPRSFVVTSSIPGEGKSTTTANLAIALAETGARVALVDGDLRLPRVAEYMGIEGGVGLTDVLIGRAELADVLQKWGKNKLFVLPSGRVPPNPSELLGSAAMARMLRALTEEFDIVLIDAPPLLLVTDAAVLSKLCGGAIMVVASGRTKRNELSSAVKALERAGSRLVGMVITMLPTKGPDSYGYGQYSYGTAYIEDKAEAESVSAGRRGFGKPRRRTA
ncbi:succinoglycan biosynthesis transport protein ExoP [Cryobacterium sp. MP_M5]|uniref:polysaccharide biosynthesis tyrosine autokinase n=1 Tax=unclassified Cryobacterium TaxID=2649013 RepID=UPI0018C9ECA7|nr:MULTISPECIES: polysaccharide biosynthesis tyrosine autokinase [unclassified Cryobacterium]MBG6060167.1 capsular exopolysaccharide synthesis family protein [Cryobacterium sp. MP_M3]MEC5178603.1 succinoglycan biosynthesis transport protein ExoP [Cryobacterium sp. MP_M5]